jgi:hypothetical protein
MVYGKMYAVEHKISKRMILLFSAPDPMRHESECEITCKHDVGKLRQHIPEFRQPVYLMKCQYLPQYSTIAIAIRQKQPVFAENTQHPVKLPMCESMIIHFVMETPEEGHVNKQLSTRLQNSMDVADRCFVVDYVLQNSIAIDSIVTVCLYFGIADVINNVRAVVCNNVG